MLAILWHTIFIANLVCLLDTGTCTYPSVEQVDLVDYGMNSVSQGIDALAITRVVIRPVGQMKPGVTPQVMFWYSIKWLCPQQVIFLAANFCVLLCIFVDAEAG